MIHFGAGFFEKHMTLRLRRQNPRNLAHLFRFVSGAILEWLRGVGGKGMIAAPDTTTREKHVATTQRVVIVNGNGDVLEQLETVLDAGHYDVSLRRVC